MNGLKPFTALRMFRSRYRFEVFLCVFGQQIKMQKHKNKKAIKNTAIGVFIALWCFFNSDNGENQNKQKQQ